MKSNEYFQLFKLFNSILIFHLSLNIRFIWENLSRVGRKKVIHANLNIKKNLVYKNGINECIKRHAYSHSQLDRPNERTNGWRHPTTNTQPVSLTDLSIHDFYVPVMEQSPLQSAQTESWAIWQKLVADTKLGCALILTQGKTYKWNHQPATMFQGEVFFS